MKAKDGSVCNGGADESVLRPADEDVSKDNGDGLDSRFSLEWELDSDDDETYEECLRIFNEVQAVGDQPASALQVSLVCFSVVLCLSIGRTAAGLSTA